MKALQLSQGAVVSHFKNSHTWLFFSPSCWGFLDSSAGKESACSTGDPSSIPGSGRSPGEGIGYTLQYCWLSFPGGSDSKESACIAGDLGSIPGLGRSPGEGKSYPLPYSDLGNYMDRGAWWATVHGVTKSDRTEQLSLFNLLQD